MSVIEHQAMQAVFEHMVECVAVYDLQGRLAYANRNTEQLLGRGLPELVGHTVSELFPEPRGSQFERAMREVAEQGGVQSFEHYHEPLQRWFQQRVLRVSEHVHVLSRDITDERRQRRRSELLAEVSTALAGAEGALEHVMSRLCEVLAGALDADCELRLLSADGVWLERCAGFSRDPRAVEISRAIPRWLASEGMGGAALRARTAQLEVAINVKREASSLSTEPPRQALLSYVPTSLLLVPLMAGEQTVGLLLFARAGERPPLSEDDRALVASVAPGVGLYVAHARREADARTLQGRLELLGNSVNALIAFVGKDLRYQYVNVGYERWFGQPRASFVGRSMRELMGAQGFARIEPHVARALAGEVVRFQTRFDYPRAGERHVDAQYAPAFGPDGKVEGFSVLVLDVTAEARLLAAERERREEERRASRRLERLLEVAARLAGAARPEHIAHIAIDEGLAALDAASSAMWLRSKDGSSLELVRSFGLSPEHRAAFTRVPLGQPGPLADAITTGKPVWVSSRADYVASYPGLEGAYRPSAPPPLSFCALPLVEDERIVGCLSFVFHDERRLHADERTFLEALALQAAEALRRSRLYAELSAVSETHRSIVQASPVAIVLLDDAARVQAWNPAAERILGWKASEVVAELCPLPLMPLSRELLQGLGARAPGDLLAHSETVLRNRHGERIDVDMHAIVVEVSGGRLMCQCMMLDISERKRVERGRQLVAEAARVLARSLEWAPIVRQLVELPVREFADWCCIDMLDDRGMLQRLAMTPDTAEPMAMVLAHDPVRGGASAAIATGKPQLITQLDERALRGFARDEAHLAAMRALAARSGLSLPLTVGDRVVGAFSFVSRTRVFDELDLSIASELADRTAVAIANARLYDEATRARTEAESANRAKDQFLAMLGHELRNPLAPITTALYIMRQRAPEQAARERAVIERQVAHLSRLVDDLLDVSRITRGKIELRRERLALADVVSAAVEMTSPLLESRRHRMTLAVDRQLSVTGDATRLAQVVANLLANAAKYTAPEGDIEVLAEREGESVVLRVRDNGMGIAADMLPSVFDSFVQAPQSRARTQGGMGLGLTIVRSLVELHGGSVSAHSEGPGRGAEIVVILPAAEPLEPAARAVPSDLPPEPERRKQRVLIVDDNADAVMLLAEVLGVRGHAIATAFDGPSALRVADEFGPDVVVLDIGLPVMDGYEVAERLRKSPRHASTRLIAVTGYGQESDRSQALAAGFHEHLAKPVSAERILALLEPSG